MSAIVIWHPEPMTARLIAAATPARQELAKAAQVRAVSASRSVAASIRVVGENVVATDPKGILFEKGVGPHTIEPKKKVLKLADGSFVSGGVEHPGMKAKPFLKPTLPLWPSIYRRVASRFLRGI